MACVFGAAGHAVDDDPIDENLVAFVGDRIDQPDLFFVALLRQLDDGKLHLRVDVTFARIQRNHALAVGPRLRARVRRADDGLQFVAQSLVGVNLVAANFDAGDARQRSFGYLESDDQTFAVDRNALQHVDFCATITEVAHVSFDRAPVLFEKREAGVAATVTEKRNQSERARFLSSQIGGDIVVSKFVGAGDANVGELEAAAAFDVVAYLNGAAAQSFQDSEFRKLRQCRSRPARAVGGRNRANRA